MPLAQLRVCEKCSTIRWAPCSTVCRAPDPTDPNSWRPNMQPGAGTIKETPLRPAIGAAIGCAIAGGTFNGGAVVGYLNHGNPGPAAAIFVLGCILIAAAFTIAGNAMEDDQ